MYNNQAFKKYLDDLASRKPAPGGGSAAALVGATGAALLSKVAHFTLGKDEYKKVEPKMNEILTLSEKLRGDLNKLCAEDVSAYKKLSHAFKLPKETAGEKEERQKKVQAALKEAALVPLNICEDTQQAIKLAVPLVQKGNTNLITDSGIAALMLECAFGSALYNVEINLNSIKDQEFIRKLRGILEPMEKEVKAISQEVNTEVAKFLKEGK